MAYDMIAVVEVWFRSEEAHSRKLKKTKINIFNFCPIFKCSGDELVSANTSFDCRDLLAVNWITIISPLITVTTFNILIQHLTHTKKRTSHVHHHDVLFCFQIWVQANENISSNLSWSCELTCSLSVEAATRDTHNTDHRSDRCQPEPELEKKLTIMSRDISASKNYYLVSCSIL